MNEDQDGRTRSFDGVEIAYSHRGTGTPSLLFIHGGLASRAFWAPQLAALGGRFRMAALDLAGHGESGRNRLGWTIPAFAQDVCAVADVLGLSNIVLVGNSLGGAVALEAAPLLGGRAIGVIGVDTLHVADAVFDPEEARARGAAFRTDFAGACADMIRALFHPGQHLDLQAWALQIMRGMKPDIVAEMLERFGGYDLGAAFRKTKVPIRALNGDLWPTQVEANQALAPGFDAVIMPGAGHYPMLERPDEFNRLLADLAHQIAESAATA